MGTLGLENVIVEVLALVRGLPYENMLPNIEKRSVVFSIQQNTLTNNTAEVSVNC